MEGGEKGEKEGEKVAKERQKVRKEGWYNTVSASIVYEKSFIHVRVYTISA